MYATGIAHHRGVNITHCATMTSHAVSELSAAMHIVGRSCRHGGICSVVWQKLIVPRTQNHK
eukprot:COSAG02_NODE_60119_length_272_cov_0.601156_1_plen_61_part_10